jgi:cyclic GMP-AMP synthase DncV-like protein
VNAVAPFSISKRQWLAGWIERVGTELDLTDTQVAEARGHYEAVGAWLADGEHPWLHQSFIFVQGSMALGTAKVPVGHDEIDVDLVQYLSAATVGVSAATVQQIVGARLGQHEVYASMLEEKHRCWRLNYAGAFHLDITPAIAHPDKTESALLVPDRRLRCWLPSNPRGFRERFERRAMLRPRGVGLTKTFDARSSVESFPLQFGPKGLLRRLIQLLKHHRDVAFQNSAQYERRPISMIITALAAQAYEYVIHSRNFETDYDLLLAVLDAMPRFIDKRFDGRRVIYIISNETVTGENFADKWNTDPQLAAAFFTWHSQVSKDLAALVELDGLNVVANHFDRLFGKGVGSRTLRKMTDELTASRSGGRLSLGPSGGLVSQTTRASPIPRNTFFGRL